MEDNEERWEGRRKVRARWKRTFEDVTRFDLQERCWLEEGGVGEADVLNLHQFFWKHITHT